MCEDPGPSLEGPSANVATVIIHVEGVVRDAITGLPLPNAQVSIPAAGERGQLQADAAGFYSVTFEGIGDFFVFVSHDGYAGSRHRALANFGDTVPDTSLNVRAVVDVLMFPLVGEVNGVIVGTGPIDAVADARVIARVEPAYVPFVDTTGIALQATTAADGSYSMSDLPAGVPLRLLVPAQDLDGDGRPDFATSLTPIGSLDVAPITQNIQVSPFITDQVVWTTFDNVESFAVAPDASFDFVFAAAMSTTPGATDIRLLRSGVRVATQHQWDAEGLVLTVSPRAPLTAGQTYSLTIEATSQTGDVVTWGPSSFTVGGDRLPGEVTGIVLVDDPATLPFSSPTMTVGFDPVDDATGYRVYARNDMGQSDWLEVAERGLTNLNPGEPEIAFGLPSAFDSLPGAGTPFGRGETLEIAVVALIGANEGPFPETLLTVSDEACPTFSVSPGGTVDNTSGTEPAELYFDISGVGGEWIDPSSTATVAFSDYIFPGAGGVGLDGGAFTLEVVDQNTLRLLGSIPAGVSAVLAQYSVDVSALTDPSGNAACADTSPITGLFGGGSFTSVVWDMEADDGFTGAAPWERGPPVGAPASGADGDVWGTTLNGNYPDTAADTFVLATADVRLPSSISQVYFSGWYALGQGDSVEVYWVPEAGGEALLTTFTFSSPFWGQRSLSASAFAGQLGHFEFRLNTDGGTPGVPDAGPGGPTADDGFFLDNLTLSGTWFAP